MKLNYFKKIGAFIMALMLMFFVSASLIVVTSLVMSDTAWAGPKEIAKEECGRAGGKFIDEGDGYSCVYPNGGTQDCTTGDYNICLWCFPEEGCIYLSKKPGLNTPAAIRARAFSMEKIPLTSIPDHRLTTRLRAIKANLIRKNKQRALMRKRGEVKDAKDRYANKKQKTAITKPTRPGVPMPTKPIQHGKPMVK